jgi:hypothetical protein
MGFLVLQVGVDGVYQGGKGRIKIVLRLKRYPLALPQLGVNILFDIVLTPQYGYNALAVLKGVVDFLAAIGRSDVTTPKVLLQAGSIG